MDHTFPVVVVSDTGAPLAAARVCFVAKAALGAEHHPFRSLAATHDDKGGGKYEEKSKITPTEGDWALLVTLKDKAPVFQPLQLKKGKGDEFTATPKPSAVATVTMTGAVRTVGANKVKEIAFHVTLHPAAELVFIAGVDYNRPDIGGGWLFHEYGFNRAESLRREKKIHAGTVVTVFSTARIWRTKRVWGVKKWVDVEVVQLGNVASRVLGSDPDSYVPVAGLDIHITDFYKYLSDIGAHEPKSVTEIGIFSHSFPGGPILYNTGEGAAFAAGAARDPDDFDARPKDFNSTNFAGYDKMPASFAPGCRFTVWGCSATTHFKFASRAALRAIEKGVAEDDFYDVVSELNNEHDPAIGVYASTVEHTSELRHRWLMDALFRAGYYAAEAAKKLDIEVRAGCPGTGSDPTPVDGIEMLMVNLTTYADVFGYFHKKFAPEFAETNTKWDRGYVDYHALQSRPAIARPAFSTQYYKLDIRKKVTRWQTTTGAKLTFWNGKSIDHPTPDVQAVIKPAESLATPGKKGHLIVLKDNDPTKSQAVFLQEDEKIFKITRDATQHWTVKGAEL